MKAHRTLMRKENSFIGSLALREQLRDRYLRHRDPLAADRMLWRAQTFRHLVHLLPGQSILELGCGEGIFTRQLVRVSRNENPITAVTFASETRPIQLPPEVTFLTASSLPGPLEGKRFDFVVAMDLLDRLNCGSALQNVYEFLNPGGEVLFYESNPWKVVLKLRRSIAGLFGRRDPRSLLSRWQLYELISQVGFIHTLAVFNDFVYSPLTQRLAWLLRNLSIILENAPAIQTLAGSILVHAQKPPRLIERPKVSLFAHEQLRRSVSIVVPCHNEEMNMGRWSHVCASYSTIISTKSFPSKITAKTIRHRRLGDWRKRMLASNRCFARHRMASAAPSPMVTASQRARTCCRWTATSNTYCQNSVTCSTLPQKGTMSPSAAVSRGTVFC